MTYVTDGFFAPFGFGTFEIRKCAVRKGRKPQTGATIKIAASKVLTLKAGKTLKDAVK